MGRLAWWVPVVDAALAPVDRRRRGRDPQEVVAALDARAARDTGFTEPLDTDFRDGLVRLYTEFSQVPDLAPLGRQSVLGEVSRRLRVRRMVAQAAAERPGLAEQPVRRPVVIVGMPRTGTTLLHTMLADAPGHRAPLTWELMCPAPQDVSEGELRRRVRQAQRMAGAAHRMAPGSEAVHPLRAEGPEECFFLLPHTYAFLVRAPLPGYEQWLAERPMDRDYAYHRLQVQSMQWGRPEARWVLKSPLHLWHLDALLGAYPDATLVWPHRDPAAVVASWCSLAETAMALHMRRYDPRGLGPLWLRLWRQAVGRAMEVRERLAPPIIDVAYEELAADPHGTVARICARLGADDDRGEGPAQTAPARPQEYRSRHHYTLERYGLDPEQVREEFADYLAAHPAAQR